MRRAAVAIGAALGVGVAYLVFSRLQAGEGLGDALSGAVGDVGDVVIDAGYTVGAVSWRAPQKYAGMIASAEDANSIPRGILERLLFQESRYREDIISGKTKSRVGALGIAQFMPATAAWLGVDPLNVQSSINGAGKYLSQLFKQFGNWSEALAAYNWGPGNVKAKGLAAAPSETRKYYSQILADAGGGVYA